MFDSNHPSRTYVVSGEPLPLLRGYKPYTKTFETQKQARIIWEIELSKQHKDLPPLHGALHVEYNFFMPLQPRRKEEGAKPHILNPTIDALIDFVNDVATGILYTHNNQICSVRARKFYSKEAQTMITITELKG